MTTPEHYFNTTPEPVWLSQQKETLKQFLSNVIISPSAKVVYITAGGTRIPLEKNTVRSIDNFSTGLRGAISAELFLSLGYHVIYAHRLGAAIPFARTFQKNCSTYFDTQFLNSLSISDTGSVEFSGQDSLGYPDLVKSVELYKQYTSESRLICLPFDTVDDYMYQMREICLALSPVGERAVVYSAAAVSDYYIPSQDTTTHKIQSGSSKLVLELTPTPKLLKCVKVWAPKIFLISFKLETDDNILIDKAEAAIQRYNIDGVVANELHSRYKRVLLIKAADDAKCSHELVEKRDDVDIEVDIVNRIAEWHQQHIIQ